MEMAIPGHYQIMLILLIGRKQLADKFGLLNSAYIESLIYLGITRSIPPLSNFLDFWRGDLEHSYDMLKNAPKNRRLRRLIKAYF